MNDVISRQAAIDTMEEYFARIGKLKRRGLNKGEKAIALDTVGAIKSLPSAQPEPHTGHWEPVGVAEVVGGESAMWGSAIAYHKCSQCGEQALEEYGEEELSDFCPNCGADMREVTDEIMLTIGEDGTASLYDDTYDITIHCESKEEQEEVEKALQKHDIVRCKECKHRDPEDKKCDCGHNILWQLPRQDDWFCADGER